MIRNCAFFLTLLITTSFSFAADDAQIIFYLPFEGNSIAQTPEREFEPEAGEHMFRKDAFVSGVSGGQAARIGKPLRNYADWSKNTLTYDAHWLKDQQEGTIVLWYKDPEWAVQTWRIPAMLTTAQSTRSKPSAWQHPLSWWIFDRLTSPPELGDSKWFHWTFGNKKDGTFEHTRNMRPRTEHDNQWHLWAMRWDRKTNLLEIIDDNKVRDISNYESLIEPGKDHWIETYSAYGRAPGGGVSTVYEDVGHIKLDEIFLGKLHLARYVRVTLDEVAVWNKALPRESIFEAYRRGAEGKPVWNDDDLPKPKRRIARLMDLTSLPQDRAALPKQVKWQSPAVFKPVTKTRWEHKLDGFWRFQPVEDISASYASDGWGYIQMPINGTYHEYRFVNATLFDPAFKHVKATGKWQYTWNDKRLPADYQKIYFERDVAIPKDLNGHRFFFRFDHFVQSMATRSGFDLFINGSHVRHIDDFGPGHVDITKWIRSGQPNRLTLSTEDNFHMLRWDLTLEAYAPAAVTAHYPYVIPEYRKQGVRIQVELENHTDQPQDVTCRATFIDADGKQIHTIESESFHVPAKKNITTFIEGKWLNPIPWRPDAPYLYTCVVETLSSSKVVDSAPPVRFGYREIWTDNGDILLNGKRLLVVGKSHNGFPVRLSKIDLHQRTNQNTDRTQYPDAAGIDGLKITDEQGWCMIYNLGDDFPDLNDPEPYKQYIRGLLRLIGNHPSVIGFDHQGPRFGFSNGPHGHPMQIGSVVSQKDIESSESYRVSRLLDELDPGHHFDLFYICGSGGQVRGIMHSMSYGMPIQEMEEWISYWASTRQDPFLPMEQQIFSRPDYFWQRGSKSSVILEHHARFFGDASYTKATRELVDMWQSVTRRWATPSYYEDMYSLAFGRVIKAWRTYGISGYLWHVTYKQELLYENGRGPAMTPFGTVVTRINAPILSYIAGPEADFVAKGHNYFSGEKITKSVVTLNDSFEDVKGLVSWKATDEDGSVIAEDAANITIKQGTRHFQPIEFVCPPTQSRSRVTIVSRFKPTGQDAEREDKYNITAFAPLKPLPSQKVIAVIDDTGETQAVLSKIGIPFLNFDDTAILQGATSFSNFHMLIIGQNSYSRAAKVFSKAIPFKNQVKEGLNVLVLPQANRNVAGLTVENLKTHRAFIRERNSPLLQGFKSEDFIEWRGESRLLPPYRSWNVDSKWRTFGAVDSKNGQENSFGQRRFWHWSNKGMVATYCFQKPQRGNFNVLMDNGFDLLYTPLVEFYEGKGRVLFCQLELIDQYDAEPVAKRLLNRIIANYNAAGEGEYKTIGYLGGSNGKALLDRLGIDYRNGLRRKSIAFVSLSEVDDGDDIARFVEKGGTIVVSIDDQNAADLLPVKLTITSSEYFKTDAPGSPVFAGIGPSDLYFRQVLEDWPLVTAVDGKQVENGMLGVVPYGKGRIIYVQLDPELFDDAWHTTKVLRIFNTVMTNIGVRSKAKLNFTTVAGYGSAEEWLPGYADKVEALDQRPMVSESPLYDVEALDFDPNQHIVW